MAAEVTTKDSLRLFDNLKVGISELSILRPLIGILVDVENRLIMISSRIMF